MGLKLTSCAAGALFFAASACAQMPTWSDPQAEVWAYVEQSWVDDAAETGEWPGEYVHDQAVTWGNDMIAPRGKSEWVDWSRYGDERGTTVLYDLTPLAISVVDDTAVVHYVAVTADEDTEGEHDTHTVGIVETLVREDGAWIYLSSVGMGFDLDD